MTHSKFDSSSKKFDAAVELISKAMGAHTLRFMREADSPWGRGLVKGWHMILAPREGPLPPPQELHVEPPLWMSKVRRAFQFLAEHGAKGLLHEMRRVGMRGCARALEVNLLWAWSDILSRRFDHRFQVDTSGLVHRSQIAIEAIGSHGAQGHDFQSVPVRTIRAALDRLPSDVTQFAFIDIGCGKGRPLLLAMERGFRRIIGVEHSPMLTLVAAHNIESWRGARRCHNVTAVCADALAYELPPDRCVLYFAGPFADKSLYEPMLTNVAASLRCCPRPMFIIYVDAIVQAPPDAAMSAAGFRRVPGRETCLDPGAARDRLQFVLYSRDR